MWGFFCLLACFTAWYVFMLLGCNLQQVNKVTGGFCGPVWSWLGTSQLKKSVVSKKVVALERSFLMETGYRAYCDMPCSTMNPVCNWQEAISHF